MNNTYKSILDNFRKASTSFHESEFNLNKLLLKQKFYKEKLKILQVGDQNNYSESQKTDDDSIFNDDQTIQEIIILKKKIYQYHLMIQLLNTAKNETKIIEVEWIQDKIKETDSKKDYKTIDIHAFFLEKINEKIKEEVFSTKLQQNNEFMKKIDEKRLYYKKEIKELEKELNFDEELKSFHVKIKKKFYAREIRKILDRLCNKNLISSDFEYTFENENLILLNLSFLSKQTKFNQYLEKVKEERKNDKNPNSDKLYERLIDILLKLEQILYEFDVNQLDLRKPLINLEGFKNTPNLAFDFKNDNKETSDLPLSPDKKSMITTCLKMMNFQGKSVEDGRKQINNELIGLNQKVLMKMEILKRHFEFFNQTFMHIENYKEDSKVIFEKTMEKMDNLVIRIKKEENDKTAFEEKVIKARKKYKLEYLKRLIGD